MPATSTTNEYTSPGGQRFTVRFEERPDYLYAEVTGRKGDHDVGVAYWRVVADEVGRRKARRLLLDARLDGPTMSPEGLGRVIVEFVGSPLEGARIAYVENSAAHVPAMEHGAIRAAELGFQARVFLDTGAAERWLRYG